MNRPVVLVGAGHAHLEVILAAAAFRRSGAELVLIEPGNFWYSGRAGGMLGGHYPPETDQIDAEALARACGAVLRRDSVIALDRKQRTLELASGESLPYELLSFNIGSAVRGSWPFEDPRLWPVKPIAGLFDLHCTLAKADRRLGVLIAGGGPSGCEIAGNLLRLGPHLEVTLISGSDLLLKGAPAGAGERVFANLRRRGADVRLGSRLARIAGNAAVLESGETIAFDHLVVASGLEANPLIRKLGLPADPVAGLTVRATLQSIGDDRIFAVGDCAAIVGYDLPKVGVHGVRAAPVLRDNLLAALDGGRLRAYRPQRSYLSVLELGDGTGLAIKGGRWMHGRAMLWLKQAIDARFLRRYRRRTAGFRSAVRPMFLR